MKLRLFGRYALTYTVALLAGCGGSQPPIGAPGAMRQSSALAARTNSTNYKVVHSFRGYPDGRLPSAGLMDVGGRLYGTTHWGGTNSDCKVYPLGSYGCGTVFSVASGGGKEKVLYRFGVGTSGRGSGSLPAAGLIAVGGVLYGTTATGGSYSGCTSSNYAGWCGTVFSTRIATVPARDDRRGGTGFRPVPLCPCFSVGGLEERAETPHPGRSSLIASQRQKAYRIAAFRIAPRARFAFDLQAVSVTFTLNLRFATSKRRRNYAAA